MPILTMPLIRRIIDDIAPSVNGMQKIGIVGSYARSDYNSNSDIDLVFALEGVFIDETLTEAGIRLKAIFLDQFRVKLDMINYADIIQNLENPENLLQYQLIGYRMMLKDLIWIWEKK